MAKRSPILGYNHNVKYRGLIFHVQTEDSGLLSPHLFTHLFYGGVILSTRKLVYDAGAAEALGVAPDSHAVSVMFETREAADSFAATLSTPPAGIAQVTVGCAD